MRIVVAGAGEVGTHLAVMLSRENHEIVIMDSDEERLEKLAESCDLLTFKGNVTSKRLLLDAGANNADLFIAVTPSDDTNIVSAIMAKRLGAKLTIVRVGSDELLSKENREMFTGLGIDSMIYPEKIAAKEVTSVLHQAGVTNIIDFSGGALSLLSVKIDENAPFAGKTLSEASDIYHMEYRAVAILRDGKTIIPSGDTRYRPGDLVYVVTNHSGIKNILKYSGHFREELKQVMILGGSHIGRLIAKSLGKKYHVKLLEAGREEAYKLSDELPDVLVINGDGTNVDLLIEEGLKRTDALIAVTSDSEANILSCLLAKNAGVKHTVAEIENLDYINLAERLGVDTVINKKLIAASHIYRYTLSGVSMIKYLTATDAEVLEFAASPKAKITQDVLKDINFPKDAIIGGVIREHSGFVATGNTQIQGGDHAIVFAKSSAVADLSNLFK